MADVVQQHGHDEHAEHGHPPFLQHHFETPAQQFDAGKLGMWIFLATEVLFFSGLFCAYVVYRANHPEIFHAGHKFLDVKWGAVNTLILILSSFTMALGVWCAQTSRRTGLIICLSLTLLGACGFMGVKAIEYTHKISHGLVWGKGYHPHEHPFSEHAGIVKLGEVNDPTTLRPGSQPATIEAVHPVTGQPALHAAAAAAGGPEVSQVKLAPTGPAGLSHPDVNAEHGAFDMPSEQEVKNVHIYFGIYFCMTGLHGIHVLAGMIVISWLLYGAIKGRYNGDYYTPIDLGGLYWHLVDLVWIYLFPLLYLVD